MLKLIFRRIAPVLMATVLAENVAASFPMSQYASQTETTRTLVPMKYSRQALQERLLWAPVGKLGKIPQVRRSLRREVAVLGLAPATWTAFSIWKAWNPGSALFDWDSSAFLLMDPQLAMAPLSLLAALAALFSTSNTRREFLATLWRLVHSYSGFAAQDGDLAAFFRSPNRYFLINPPWFSQVYFDAIAKEVSALRKMISTGDASGINEGLKTISALMLSNPDYVDGHQGASPSTLEGTELSATDFSAVVNRQNSVAQSLRELLDLDVVKSNPAIRQSLSDFLQDPSRWSLQHRPLRERVDEIWLSKTNEANLKRTIDYANAHSFVKHYEFLHSFSGQWRVHKAARWLQSLYAKDPQAVSQFLEELVTLGPNEWIWSFDLTGSLYESLGINMEDLGDERSPIHSWARERLEYLFDEYAAALNEQFPEGMRSRLAKDSPGFQTAAKRAQRIRNATNFLSEWDQSLRNRPKRRVSIEMEPWERIQQVHKKLEQQNAQAGQSTLELEFGERGWARRATHRIGTSVLDLDDEDGYGVNALLRLEPAWVFEGCPAVGMRLALELRHGQPVQEFMKQLIAKMNALVLNTSAPLHDPNSEPRPTMERTGVVPNVVIPPAEAPALPKPWLEAVLDLSADTAVELYLLSTRKSLLTPLETRWPGVLRSVLRYLEGLKVPDRKLAIRIVTRTGDQNDLLEISASEVPVHDEEMGAAVWSRSPFKEVGQAIAEAGGTIRFQINGTDRRTLFTIAFPARDDHASASATPSIQGTIPGTPKPQKLLLAAQ